MLGSLNRPQGRRAIRSRSPHKAESRREVFRRPASKGLEAQEVSRPLLQGRNGLGTLNRKISEPLEGGDQQLMSLAATDVF